MPQPQSTARISERLTFKPLDTPRVREDGEELELSPSPVESITWYPHFEEQFCSLSEKVKYLSPVGSSNFTPWYLLRKKKESTCPYKNLYKIVHISLIFNRQKTGSDSKIPQQVNRLKELWYIHVVECY